MIHPASGKNMISKAHTTLSPVLRLLPETSIRAMISRMITMAQQLPLLPKLSKESNKFGPAHPVRNKANPANSKKGTKALCCVSIFPV